VKKKHYKQSKSRKLYDESCVFFDKYENNVTRKYYKINYRRFIKFCREHYGCKTKAECMEHILDYVQHLIEKGLSASTIHTYLVPVALYHGVDLSLLNLPTRHTADNTRSRKERKHYRTNGDENNPKYAYSVGLQKCVGIRRDELKNLRGSDFVTDESGYPCVRVRQGKGGKMTLQRILPEDVDFVSSYFDGTENKVFTAEEMNNQIDYHSMRAVQAFKAYNFYLEKIETEPEYRKTLEEEIIRRWNKYNIDKTTKKPKPFDKKEISGRYFVRGKNKELAIKNGLPLSYDRLAVMAVSVFHLSHWRNDVTIANYILNNKI